MIKVYIDGACEPKNPGGVATYGVSIYKDNLRIYKEKGLIGEGSEMSNNVAEYGALCKALSWLKSRYSLELITIMSDSQLLINQMNKKWKVNGGFYLETYWKALKLKESFQRISFKWIPREENTEADELSKLAYEQY